jgi:type I restriction enzyme S subunit
LEHQVSQQWFQRNAKQTSGQVNLTLAMCQDLPIPKLSDSEQDEIVVRMDAIQAAISSETTRFSKLRLLKRGLMGDLLTGRVRVTNLLDEVAA